MEKTGQEVSEPEGHIEFHLLKGPYKNPRNSYYNI